MISESLASVTRNVALMTAYYVMQSLRRAAAINSDDNEGKLEDAKRYLEDSIDTEIRAMKKLSRQFSRTTKRKRLQQIFADKTNKSIRDLITTQQVSLDILDALAKQTGSTPDHADWEVSAQQLSDILDDLQQSTPVSNERREALLEKIRAVEVTS